MSDWIRIDLEDFYKNHIGETEGVYVSPEVYEVLVNTFRREEHAELMRDLRNRASGWYEEGSTEELLMDAGESLEDMIIRQMDMKILQQAMQSLSKTQKNRLYMYFFEGLTVRDIARIEHTNRNAIWKSIQGSIKKLKKFFI